ncbi:MAG TPA: hypothetical protein VFR14_09250 [Candidatus Limnocylindrales bacterium]|nr:hypothetical protein [Candidatus Limnocylindrales bacterium]
MDHAEALERIELAAAEPGGLDRLAAGDTADAAAVAAHVAGCPDCAAELERNRRTAAVVRDVIRTTPPDDLRARTLGYVRAVGRERGPATASGEAPTIATAVQPPVGVTPALVDRMPERSRRSTRWIAAALAATVVVSVVASSAVVGLVASRALDDRDAAIAGRDEVVEALATVTAWSLRVSGEADARSVRLTSPGGGDASATILYSPSTRELVVVAEDLVEPPAGTELRCWVEVDGSRKPVGRMFFGGGLSYWVGDVEAVEGLTDDAVFGISLTDPAGGGSGGEPVLRGEL